MLAIKFVLVSVFLTFAVLFPASARGETITTGQPLLMLVPEYPRAVGGPFPFGAQDLSVWRTRVPRIEEVDIRSSLDKTIQKALFYTPTGDSPKPLLVVLHSWSENYLQNIGIPYAIFAERNGWALIHPDHRGPYRKPEAVASELSLGDVLDAVEYAKKRARFDSSRIYLVGYSGSAMTSLVLAGKHPEIWAGVVSWVPIYDLVDWYEWMQKTSPERHYAGEIAAACGGRPIPGSPAEKECRRRSPSQYLSNARGRVPVYLGLGIWDHLVPPNHALRAFNDLASPNERIPEGQLRELDRTRRVPHELVFSGKRPLYEQAGAKVLLERSSLGSTVTIFQGGHDIIYNAGLAWLAERRR
ncbi:MAG: alpha/beta fold hydrolase [Polyangiaceae bacterium]|nr:alpha/beta fold hydrolase [Polyangiaceae bacterium]